MLMGRAAIDTAQRNLLIILGRGQAQNQLNYLRISLWPSLVFYFFVDDIGRNIKSVPIIAADNRHSQKGDQ